MAGRQPKTFDELTEPQQRACHVFSKKYATPLEDVAPNLDTFFKVDRGEMTIFEAEKLTGLVIIDQTHPSLFD